MTTSFDLLLISFLVLFVLDTSKDFVELHPIPILDHARLVEPRLDGNAWHPKNDEAEY